MFGVVFRSGFCFLFVYYEIYFKIFIFKLEYDSGRSGGVLVERVGVRIVRLGFGEFRCFVWLFRLVMFNCY